MTFLRWRLFVLTLVLSLGGGIEAQGSPGISGFEPKIGLAGTEVQIFGQELVAANRVYFNGVEAKFSVNTLDGSVKAVVPVGAVTGRILVFTPTGFAASAQDFVIGEPGPEIIAFTPQAPIGADVVVVLSRAVPVVEIDFNGVKAQFRLISDTLHLAEVPTGANSGPITVTFEGGTSTSRDGFGLIQGPIPFSPVIAGFSPIQGSVGREVLITGANLTDSVKIVQFGGVTARFSVTPQGLLATVPTGAQTGNISVVTLQGLSISNTPFVILSEPEILGFEPRSGPAGTEIEIFGRQIANATDVLFSGISAPFRVNQASGSLIARVPLEAKTGRISVSTPNGVAVSSDDFNFAEPNARITAFTASGRPGDTVVLVLNPSLPVRKVMFTEIETSFSQINLSMESLVLTRVPEGAKSGQISVFFQEGGTITRDLFTVTQETRSGLPSVSGFSPAQGTVGTHVLISGANLTNEVLAVLFDEIPASFLSTPEGLIATVPTGTRSGFVSVVTLRGASVSSVPFVIGPHRVHWEQELSFAWDPPVDRTDKVIMGYRLYLGNAEGRIFSVKDVAESTTATALKIGSGLATNGTYVVYVTAFNTAESEPSDAVVFELQPSIDALSASSGYVEKRILVSGRGFVDISEVTFNGAKANFQVLSPTQIEAEVPLAASSGVLELVTHGGSSVPAGNFAVLPSYDLKLNQIGLDQIASTETPLTFAALVQNRGPLQAENVTLSISVPREIELNPVSVNGVPIVLPGSDLVVNIGTLFSGASAQVETELKFKSPGLHSLTSSVRSDGTDHNLANNSVSSSFEVFSPQLLSIRSSTAGQIEVSWPAKGGNFRLESITPEALPSENWQPVPDDPRLVEGINIVVLTIGKSPQFFRLRAIRR